MEYDTDQAVSAYRNAIDRFLENGPSPALAFSNPTEANHVSAAVFFSHTDLRKPEIVEVLALAYPRIRTCPEFLEEVVPRVRFIAWMTTKGFEKLEPAYHALAQAPEDQRLLGFRRLPSYETLRNFANERLPGAVARRLATALLHEERKLLPTLGQHQVEDSTPLEARRRDQEARYNGHYKTRMYKTHLRWDPHHDALLASEFSDGVAYDGGMLPILSERLVQAGITGVSLAVDGAYPSFLNIATQWRLNQPLTFKMQEGWVVRLEDAIEAVTTRYQGHWKHPDFITGAGLDAKLRFLFDHGSSEDREAVGRLVRDRALMEKTPAEEKFLSGARSRNEALNGEFKRLPVMPARKGELEMRRRVTLCVLTIHLVQLTRLQHGVTTLLCRTASII